MKSLLFYRFKNIIYDTGANWDKLAPTIEDAINFAHRNINPEPIKPLPHSPCSLEYTLASDGENINKRLRNDYELSNLDIQISDMVATHSCKTDLVLYRGINDYVNNLMIDNAEGLKGIDYHEKGYMQCSLIKGHELDCKTKLRIFVPAGSHVIYLGNVNNEQDYYEVDIQHGAKLKIITIDKEYINCKLIETE
ncbi:ADP-ribosyltransferase [Butyrivibrio sp. INlla16]|uniref:ADP-ribosyltransferase n=1 Tax=Butyrivibrio sp. INlla16 TaxID=1520807 RepID=UPI00088E310F|nr:ADP-ribosyltransferase [Butyrivibrio sp. INlla16]SDB68355.1 ADP-ribosyltransferase exoenzyme [Butyrivibrio sp. INlla16]